MLRVELHFEVRDSAAGGQRRAQAVVRSAIVSPDRVVQRQALTTVSSGTDQWWELDIYSDLAGRRSSLIRTGLTVGVS
jgi:hypothetical protein